MKDRLFGAGVALFLVITATIALHAQSSREAREDELPAVALQPVPTLAPIIERVSPAVVNIATRGSVEVQGQGNPLFEDPFFRRFFDVPEQFGPRERQFQAAGSGVIVDAENGYIVTNAHVVDNADEITVTMRDNREIKAEVVGSDPASDVALLKTEANDLTEIPLADSTEARVGDFVVAIGNPFGLQHTVTSGIISALGRSGISPAGPQSSYEDFIQTDASINPGNSGGALVNLRGELVGINSAIFTRTGGNIGIGFAIPSAMVNNVMEQLIEFGEVRRGLLGVQIGNLTPDLTEPLGLDITEGALVTQVQAGSAADEAGIEAGDVIVSANGKQIGDANELRNVIGLQRVGDEVQLELIHDGKRRRITAELGELEQSEPVVAQELHEGLAGAEFADIDENSPVYQGAAGVMVTAIAPGSPAFLSGLRANDVITHVNRQPISNLNELREAAEGANALVLALQRGDSNLLIPIR
ncbi:MAG: DegQ family serine endoprotease [Gammaproteobacteria bacterium]|nr:DegQ family serine endoprotease [Gammaproteobacteria bacterium]